MITVRAQVTSPLLYLEILDSFHWKPTQRLNSNSFVRFSFSQCFFSIFDQEKCELSPVAIWLCFYRCIEILDTPVMTDDICDISELNSTWWQFELSVTNIFENITPKVTRFYRIRNVGHVTHVIKNEHLWLTVWSLT